MNDKTERIVAINLCPPNQIDIMHKSSLYWERSRRCLVGLTPIMLLPVLCSGVKQDRNTCGWAPIDGLKVKSRSPKTGWSHASIHAATPIHSDLFNRTIWNHIPCISDPLPKHLSQAAGAMRHPGGLLSEQLSMGTEAVLPGS